MIIKISDFKKKDDRSLQYGKSGELMRLVNRLVNRSDKPVHGQMNEFKINRRNKILKIDYRTQPFKSYAVSKM